LHLLQLSVAGYFQRRQPGPERSSEAGQVRGSTKGLAGVFDQPIAGPETGSFSFAAGNHGLHDDVRLDGLPFGILVA
jgi:hypothetical protein